MELKIWGSFSVFLWVMLVQGSELSVLCKLGVAIDGNNHEVKERHIHLVKKRGKVKALDEELYSK